MKRISLQVFLFGFLFWYGFGFFNLNNDKIKDFNLTVSVIAVFFIAFVTTYLWSYHKAKKRIGYDSSKYTGYLKGKTVLKISLITLSLMLFYFITQNSGMVGYHTLRLLVVSGIVCYVFSLYVTGPGKIILLGLFLAVLVISAGMYSRRLFLSVIATIIICKFVQGKPLSLKNVMSLLVGAIFAFLLLAYVTGLRQNDYALTDLVGSVFLGLEVFATGSGFDTIFLTDYVIQNYNIDSYLYGESFFAGIFNLIPRAIWDSKPLAFSITLSAQYFGVSVDNIFTNFGPGIVAEAYANGGVVFLIFIGVCLGLFCAYADVFVEQTRRSPITLVFASIFYTALFFMVRGDFVNSFYEIYFKFGGGYILLLLTGVISRLRILRKYGNEQQS